jgi:hypothetical protein
VEISKVKGVNQGDMWKTAFQAKRKASTSPRHLGKVSGSRENKDTSKFGPEGTKGRV